MNFKRIPIALAALALASFAFAFTQWIEPTLKNPLPKYLPGKWTLDKEMTTRLGAEGRIKAITDLVFTNDPSVLQKLSGEAARLKGLNLIMSGMVTMNDNTMPYVISEKEGVNTLIWFHQGVETKAGDPACKIINLVFAKEDSKDMLFLGDEAGIRGATVCYTRAP